MQCITPMVRIYYDVEKQNPDEKIYQKIIPRSQVFDNLQSNNNYLSIIQDKNEKLKEQGSKMRYQLIPCRHCWACNLNYSKDWATRITMECANYEHRYFVTLTYDEANLPLYGSMLYTDKEGNISIFENDGTWTGTLEPRDLGRFMDNIRHYYRRKYGIKNIKYFAAGEYGEKGQRPHYHLILFGVPLDIKQFHDFKIDKNHKLHWKSPELERFWGKGLVDIAEVEWSSAAYVARYCMKKINFDNDSLEYAKLGKLKEFTRMSRRPAIGYRYYDKHKHEIYENDEIITTTVKGNINVIKPPKAFDKKFKEEHPEEWESIKASREAAAERSRKLEQDLTKGISDLELYERKAQKILKIGQMLPRNAEFDE